MRKKEWARQISTEVLFDRSGGVDTPTTLFADLTADFQSALGINMLLPGCTIGGLHVNYSALMFQSPAASVSTETGIIWGIIAGGYSLPGGPFGNQPPEPLAQPHEDWMWWEYLPFAPSSSTTVNQTTSVGRGDGPSGLVVRSKRRLDELGDGIFLVAQVDPTAFGSTPTDIEVTVTFTTSTLLLLP